jgi:hypothetical protein
MFGFFEKNSFNSLSDREHLYIRNIQELQEQVKTLKAKYEGTYDASFCFDFSRMNPFSIERLVSNGAPATVISFIWKSEISDNSSKNEISQWYFGCSEKTHEELVQEFTKYKLMPRTSSLWK